MSNSIGRLLQESREQLGYTIEDVAKETKIQKRYIRDMETENFEDMPGKVYERGFLKTYATLLGLDVDSVIELYENRSMDEKKVVEEEVVEERVEVPKSKNMLTLLFGGVLLIAVGAFFIMKFVLVEEEVAKSTPISIEEVIEVKDIAELEEVEKGEETSIVVEEKVEDIVEEVEKEVVKEKELVQDEAKPASSSVKIAKEEKKLLTLKLSGESWLEVRKNGKRIHFDMAKAGEFKVEGLKDDKFYVKIGDGSKVEAFLNGESLGVLGSEKEVVKKTF